MRSNGWKSMVEDIRSYLELVKTAVPDEYVEIEKEVDPLYEATAIVKKLEDQGKYPLVLFKNMRNLKGVPGHKHLINLLASRRRLALAFGLRPDQWKVELMQEVLRKSGMRLKTVTVAPGEAPVKEVVRVGEKADLADLPMLKEHEMDGSHYTTMPVVVYKGPEAGYNSAHARMMYAGKREGRFLFAPTHTWTVLRENELKKSNTRAAVVLGHHPA
jgi:2,5-furandicarboxylate decarboxylase 1